MALKWERDMLIVRGRSGDKTYRMYLPFGLRFTRSGRKRLKRRIQDVVDDMTGNGWNRVDRVPQEVIASLMEQGDVIAIERVDWRGKLKAARIMPFQALLALGKRSSCPTPVDCFDSLWKLFGFLLWGNARRDYDHNREQMRVDYLEARREFTGRWWRLVLTGIFTLRTLAVWGATIGLLPCVITRKVLAYLGLSWLLG